MKILELRLKNLNSLYGEWIIDFSHSDYVADGIFALTGPTGAGKSTLLDAVCLALYGATPRLGKITKSGNEIMSRQTGECYAEVLFESQAGRFRCHWEQRRARKKATGKLQDQTHQIIDEATGKPIEAMKSLVAGVIEEKTGMDFDRFTRSMLLAQGSFDTFLKADAEQKSRLLEQITGTGIYSEISRRVHERQRDEREKLKCLHAETAGIVTLEPAEETALQEMLGASQQQAAELAGKITATERAISWLHTIADLKKEVLGLTDEATTLAAEIQAFEPERARLEQAGKAVALEGLYATLTALRHQQTDTQLALATEQAALPELEVVASTQAEALKTAEQLTLKTKAELKAAAPLLRKVRALDEKIAEQSTAVTKQAEVCSREAVTIEQDKRTRQEALEKRGAAETIRAAAEHYLKAHAQDEWLIGGLAGIEAQLGNLLAKQQEITQQEMALKEATKAVATAAKQQAAAVRQCSLKTQAVAQAGKELQQGRDALNELLGDKLLREYRAEKESLLREIALIRKIEELEDHRVRLEDGKPCPLCGATEHPFATGNVPVPDTIEQKIATLTQLITRAEAQEATLKTLEQTEINARKQLNESEKREADAAYEQQAAETAFTQAQDALLKLQAGYDTLQQTIAEKLTPLGVTEIPETEAGTLLDSLKSRLQAWQEQEQEKSAAEKQLTIIDSEVQRLDAVLETQAGALTEKQKNLEQLSRALAAASDERRQLYGDKQPDQEEARLYQFITDAEAAEKQAISLNTGLQKKLTTAQVQIEALRQRIEQMAPELAKAEAGFSAALTSAGFADEQAFLGARLPPEECAALSARLKVLDDHRTTLNVRRKECETRLATEVAKQLTDQAPEALGPQLEADKKALQQLRDDIAGLKYKLSEHKAAQERVREKQAAVEAQKKECQRWDKLHELIGSADGKKYRTYAQGLTFDVMVSHANQQLEKITDRYLLIRDTQQPLELSVVDNYQAGEIRSTRNLSGGESFIVSLTLALGLSKMASRKVRVDSLFLDEGFGTLDEDALETALETLSGLQQDGKLIGVISHVSALKDRISTQINITPVSGGRSSLAGPGVQKA